MMPPMMLCVVDTERPSLVATVNTALHHCGDESVHQVVSEDLSIEISHEKEG